MQLWFGRNGIKGLGCLATCKLEQWCVACKSKHVGKCPSPPSITSGLSAGQQVQYFESTEGMLPLYTQPSPLLPFVSTLNEPDRPMPTVHPYYQEVNVSCSHFCWCQLHQKWMELLKGTHTIHILSLKIPHLAYTIPIIIHNRRTPLIHHLSISSTSYYNPEIFIIQSWNSKQAPGCHL